MMQDPARLRKAASRHPAADLADSDWIRREKPGNSRILGTSSARRPRPWSSLIHGAAEPVLAPGRTRMRKKGRGGGIQLWRLGMSRISQD